MTKPFSFGGQEIHHLNNLSHQQNYSILIGDSLFNYSLEQLALLSPLVLEHYMETSEPFRINFPFQSQTAFKQCFSQLDSLFHTQNDILLTYENVKAFSFISELLDNFFLSFLCESVSETKNQTFSFTSQQFLFLPKKTKSVLKDFTFIINNIPFQVNFPLFCCVSKLFCHDGVFENQLSFSVSQ
jgi:hypothetical protein